MRTPGFALAAVFVSAAVIGGIRLLPFILFRNGAVPRGMDFIEKYMSPVAMAVLTVASLASVSWTRAPHGIPELAGVALTAAVHLYRRNVLLSIAVGTGAYMALRYLLGG